MFFLLERFVGGLRGGSLFGGLALSVSAVGAMIAGPFLGRWADRRASKKPALLGVTLVCVIGTALFGLGKWGVEGAVAILVVANSAFLLGENLVASFLPELAEAGQRGRVSAYGWAFGYLGGLISLGLALLLLRQGGESATQQVFLMTAVFIFVASLPTALFLRERAVPQVLVPVEPDWKTILRTVQANPNLMTLLLGLTLALAGLSAVVGFASIYATKEIGFTLQGTVKLFVCLQVAAAVGALVTGRWQDRGGAKPVLLWALGLWVLVSVGAWWSRSAELFYIVAVGAGVGMGWLQSAGRAAVAEMTPVGREGECFGLWGFAGKLAGIGGALGVWGGGCVIRNA